MTRPRIAVCFFGITRGLTTTAPSIHEHILGPARRTGHTTVVAHFFRQTEVADASRGTTAPLDPQDADLLHPDIIEWSEPGTILGEAGFDAVKIHGDYWRNDFVSLRNLVHQLYSLRHVTRLALETAPDVVVFCRPDLLYHDPLGAEIDRALAHRGELAILPRWQCWRGGLNDRFAIARGERAARAYGMRLDLAETYCTARGLPLHAERLVRFALPRNRITLRHTDARASRIRADGYQVTEEFRPRRWRTLQQRLKYDWTAQPTHRPGV